MYLSHFPVYVGSLGSSECSFLLQSTLFFAWTFPWSRDHTPPSRQATSAQRPITHYIPQCYATQPHEQATTPYESTPCRGPPSSCGHPCPMSTKPLPEPLPEPLVLEPPVEPLVPIPWNIHCRQYSSMEEFVKHVIQNLVSWPVDNLDSPLSDTPPLEPDPVTPYLLDSPEGHTHTLSPGESPTEPWQRWLDRPDSPVSHKHSLSLSSPSSAPIRQCTSWEGSYHSITPQMSSPTASTEALSEGNQSVSPSKSLDSTPSMQTPAPVNDNELSLNWVTLPHTYQKG